MTDTSITASAESTIRTYFEEADGGDADRVRPLFTEDVEIRFGNTEATTGFGALLDTAQMLQTVCSGMQHDITDVFVDADQEHGTAELAMTYVRHDGSELRVPAAGVFAFTPDHRIARYHVYVDLSELLPAPDAIA